MDLVKEITSVVREADAQFRELGGSTRHWVRDLFLPIMEERGHKILLKPTPLEVFFKVVLINGNQYRPSLELCGGCPHLTAARGWECYYKRQTTECAYPTELEERAAE